MNNIMLDIETMGNTPNAAIVSIAAVYFDKTGTGRSFYKKVSLESSVEIGLEMDTSTVLWWLKQDDTARKEFETKGDPLYSVLRSLDSFIAKGCCIWGNGASFDNVILANAYGKLKMETPWKFYNNRCFQTLKNLFPNVGIAANQNKHNALDDALWQALYAVKVLIWLDKLAPVVSESPSQKTNLLTKLKTYFYGN